MFSNPESRCNRSRQQTRDNRDCRDCRAKEALGIKPSDSHDRHAVTVVTAHRALLCVPFALPLRSLCAFAVIEFELNVNFEK